MSEFQTNVDHNDPAHDRAYCSTRDNQTPALRDETAQTDEVYVITTPRGYTQVFDQRQIRALVLLGLIEHERDGWLLESGKGEHLGPVHHFYREADHA